MRSNLYRLLVVGPVGLVSACGARARAPQAPAAPSPPAAEPGPQPLTTNTERDRRGDAGVRAAAKPLVREAKRTPKCGKLASAALRELKSAKAKRDVLVKSRSTKMLDEMQRIAETLRAKP